MIKFHDYNPAEPFAVENEFHDIADGKVVLNYTPKKGTVKVKLDGVEAIEATSSNPEAGQFYIDYAVSSDYRMATQQVVFNASDNGKRAVFDYQGVSTLIRAEHFNEIRDFMNNYNEDRARTLVRGEAPPRKGESVENFAKPKLTNTLKIEVIGTVGTMITVDDVAGLEVGGVYTISDGEKYEQFTVASINSVDKVVTAESLENSYDGGCICVSTATILNGKAYVAGDSQTVIWDDKAEWKGTQGVTTETIPLNFKNAVFDGLSKNEEGVLEVENVPQGEFYILTPSAKVGKEFFSLLKPRIKEEPKAFFSTKVNSMIWRFCMTESGDVIPLTYRDLLCVPKMKLVNAKVLNLTNTVPMIYVPPMWVKNVQNPVTAIPTNSVAISFKEREGYKLLSCFTEQYPEGFYASSQQLNDYNFKTVTGTFENNNPVFFALFLYILSCSDTITTNTAFKVDKLPTSSITGFNLNIDKESVFTVGNSVHQFGYVSGVYSVANRPWGFSTSTGYMYIVDAKEVEVG